MLAANCQDSSGHWQNALLHEVQGCRSDIINDDGSLRCSRGVGYQAANQAGLPGGTYTQSCQEIRLHGDDLEARCPTASGDWKGAKLDDYNKCHGDIVNDNGKLRCIVTPGYQAGYTAEVAVGVTTGPYTQTCKDIKNHDGSLEARCQTRGGDWRKTSLDDFAGCHGQIVNEDGYLHCVAAAGYVVMDSTALLSSAIRTACPADLTLSHVMGFAFMATILKRTARPEMAVHTTPNSMISRNARVKSSMMTANCAAKSKKHFFQLRAINGLLK